MQTLMANLNREEVDTFGLVLQASGIAYQSVYGADGWDLRVDEEMLMPAADLIRIYLQENKSKFSTEREPAVAFGKTFAGLWGALVIAAVHVAVFSNHDAASFVQAYGSSAQQILNGEWYRCITSLLLHADAVHLVGNIVGIGLFGSAVCSVMGWGMGWGLMLLSGALGNWINAWFYQTGHVSIGASTAVFGAVGLLSAFQFITKIRVAGERHRAFLPLAGGLALLALLGAAVRTDVMAHLFGFFSGLVMGGIYRLAVKRPARLPMQLAIMAMTLAALVGAWLAPLGQ